MKLPSIISKDTKNINQPKSYIAVQIGVQHAKAAIWKQKNEKAEILKVVNGITPEEVLRKITEESSSQYVLFGVQSEYVEKDKIKPEKKIQLKQICEEFSLFPLGFVVTTEALIHFLEHEQASPITAILIYITKKSIEFSLVRMGKCIQTITKQRTEDLLSDFENGLMQFTTEDVLPAKIIINNEDIEITDLQDNLLNYSWQDNNKFLHVPKIEILPWEYSIEAIIHEAAHHTESITAHALAKTTNLNETQNKDREYTTENTEPQKEDNISHSNYIYKDIKKTSPDMLGFFSEEKEPSTHSYSNKIDNNAPAFQKETISHQPSVNSLPISSQNKHALKLPRLPKYQFFLPKFKIRSLPLPHNMLITGASIALVLFVSFGAVVYAYPKTTIKLFTNPKITTKELNIALNTTTDDIDIENGQIPGTVHSVTVSTEKSKEATGKKTIGEKAKGTVTIYNKKTDEITFKKGTILSTKNVSFTLNDEVKVASASDTGESLQYGKATAAVTAVEIGPEGNIEPDIELTIKDVPSSTAIAKSNEKFSGGTKRDITIVSKDDQEGLVLGAMDELKQQAQDELNKQVESNETFLDKSLSENIVEKSFDKKAGEEGDNVTLNLVLEISQVSYKKEDIDRYLSNYMKKQIPEGYALDTNKSFFKVLKTNQDKDGNITFTANYHAVLFPEIETATIREKIAGKTENELASLVKNLSDKNIIGYEIVTIKSIPFFSNRFPFNKNNISIQVEAFEN